MSTAGKDIRSSVLDVLRDAGFEVDGLADDVRLEDLEVDSTELVELAVALEKRVGVSLDLADLVTVETLGDLVRHVESTTVAVR